MGDQNLLSRALEGTLSRLSRLHLQSLAPTNPHWAGVVGYGLFSLCVIHKEGMCPSSGDINRLMMTSSLSGGKSNRTSYLEPKTQTFRVLIFD
jgi:hypothetical protein